MYVNIYGFMSSSLLQKYVNALTRANTVQQHDAQMVIILNQTGVWPRTPMLLLFFYQLYVPRVPRHKTVYWVH